MLTYALIFIITFFMMEFVAWFTHKFVMHGFCWFLHRDHHQVNHEHVFQKNDLFFLYFATPGIILIYFGVHGFPKLLSIGLGITFYGLIYTLVHEIFIHKRIKLFGKTRNPYFAALRTAHAVHHKTLEKDGARCFGMLIVPWQFYKDAWNKFRDHNSQAV